MDLVSLPDDVLICILEKLDLLTQLKMTHVHTRFLTVMPQVWRSQCRFMTLSLIELHLSDKDLRFFLGSNQATFQVLRMKMEKRVNFDILTGYVYPNVHDFRFSTNSFWLEDSDIPRILRAFPNLKTFSPEGRLTGQHLEDFPDLENLTVSHCRNLKLSNLLRILEKRTLKGLKLGIFDYSHFEETKLPLDRLRDLELLQCEGGEMAGCFLEHLPHLSKLKQVIFLDFVDWEIMKSVLRSSNRQNVKSVQLTTSGINLLLMFDGITVPIQTLKVARAIIIICDRMPRTFFENVTQIYLTECSFFEKEDFCILLEGLKTPEILRLDYCTFDFEEYTFSAQEIAKDRRTALHLHLHENVYRYVTVKKGPMVWKVKGEHSLFKLHEDSLNITFDPYPASICFE